MPPDPLILAFDTSAAHCAAALLLGDRVLAARTEDMAKGQAERLFGLLQDLLKSANKDWSDLTAIAVGTGPGNFTGIRISVSAARGLALSLGIPAIGVSTFDALAYDLPRPVIATIDARRGQTFAQLQDHDRPATTAIIDNVALPPGFQIANAACVGASAGDFARQTGGQAATPLYDLPVALGLVAITKLGTDQPRPAPLYVRLPDAAPSSDPPPVIFA